MTIAVRHGAWGDVWRFALAGVLNTGLTFVVYQLMLFAASPSIAYATAWLCGLAFVLFFYPTRVFGAQAVSWSSVTKFAFLYITVFLLGLGAMQMLLAAGLSPRLAIILVIGVTTTANFLAGRLLFR